MIEKKYSATITAIKTGTPFIIVIISEAVHAAADAAGIETDIGTTYAAVTFVYALVAGLKNWLKNRKKKGLTDDGFDIQQKKIDFD